MTDHRSIDARDLEKLAEKWDHIAATENDGDIQKGIWACTSDLRSLIAEKAEPPASNAPVCDYCDLPKGHREAHWENPAVPAATSAPPDEAQALADFTEYFCTNYPGPKTIITDPKWHAPKIFRAAQRAFKAAAPSDDVAASRALALEAEWWFTRVAMAMCGADPKDECRERIAPLRAALEAAKGKVG